MDNTKKDKVEYMVYFWGGAWNTDANPSIKDDLNIECEKAYYFDTEEEMNNLIDKVNQPKYIKQGVMHRTRHGILKHKDTVFIGAYQYKNKCFTIEYNFGVDYEESSAEHYMLNGSMACDCNLSNYARRQYGTEFIPKLNCGTEIKLLDYHFEYR